MKFYFRISTISLIVLFFHYIIINFIISAEFIIPLWKVYGFNFASLSAIYFGLLINFKYKVFNHLYLFVFETILKMIIAQDEGKAGGVPRGLQQQLHAHHGAGYLHGLRRAHLALLPSPGPARGQYFNARCGWQRAAVDRSFGFVHQRAAVLPG